MRIRTFAASTLSAALMSAVAVATPAVAGESCGRGSEVRELVATFVGDIRDDVKSKEARKATRLALVESMRTFRGERADSRAERRGLGQEISDLARQQRDAENRVEGQALAAAILALTEQRERSKFRAGERKELKGSVSDLEAAIVDRADSQGEGEEISAAIRELLQQFTCKPA